MSGEGAGVTGLATKFVTSFGWFPGALSGNALGADLIVFVRGASGVSNGVVSIDCAAAGSISTCDEPNSKHIAEARPLRTLPEKRRKNAIRALSPYH
jgi:hypothetical protein